MALLFYFLSALLFLWALLALALVVHSARTTYKRTRNVEIRLKLQELFHALVSETGSLALLRGGELADEMLRLAAKDRTSMRDFLIDRAVGLDDESLRPLSEAYETLRLDKDDVKILHTGKWHDKAEACLRLGRMRCASATEVLTGALRDENIEVRIAAVCALAEIGDARSVAAIIYSLSDANGWQVLQVADKLLHMKVDITRLLLELLQSSGAIREKREAAAKMVLELITDFGQRGCERLSLRPARSAAIQFLNSDSIDMRARAIRAIAAVGIENNEELDLLLNRLNDKEWEIRAVTAKALGQLHLDSAIPMLTQALTDKAWWVRHNAAHALAILGKRGLEALQAQTMNPDRFARDIAKQVIEELQLDAAIRAES